ncbi:MAG: hypothetical protein Kow00121_49170 [Elainellaceae cyanobacterium]
MNYRTTCTRRLASLFSNSNPKLRAAILTIGVAVNGAIWLYPAPNQLDSRQMFNTVAYQPPLAAATQRQTVQSAAYVPDSLNEQATFEQADTLARSGDRQAAVEQYLQAMTERIESQSR